MKSKLPTGRNPLANTHEMLINTYKFTQVLDYGRYTIRVDPIAGRGWFKSEIRSGQTAGTLHFQGKQVISASEELPPQVGISLERAGYMLDLLYCVA